MPLSPTLSTEEEREEPLQSVIPTKVGISWGSFPAPSPEIPAFAGMTKILLVLKE